MENPIILIYYCFENLCLVILGGVLFNYLSQQKLKMFITTALCAGIFLYLIRNILMLTQTSVMFHIPITLAFFIFVLHKIGKIELLISCITGFLGYTILFFNDTTMLTYYIRWFNLNVESIVRNIYLHMAFGLLTDLTLVTIILLVVLAKYIYRLQSRELI